MMMIMNYPVLHFKFVMWAVLYVDKRGNFCHCTEASWYGFRGAVMLGLLKEEKKKRNREKKTKKKSLKVTVPNV